MSEAIDNIKGVLRSKAKLSNAQKVALIEAALAEAGELQPEPEDPFEAIRNRAIELHDLDGYPTFVTVAAILDRIQAGWIPALVALTSDEAHALDHVLRIWEHELRLRLARLVQFGEQQEPLPWQTLGDMTKAQQAYRDRLALPAHPHGECCTHYMEVKDHDPVALAAGQSNGNGHSK